MGILFWSTFKFEAQTIIQFIQLEFVLNHQIQHTMCRTASHCFILASILLLVQGFPSHDFSTEKARGERLRTLIKLHKEEFGSARNHHFGQRLLRDINNHKLVRNKRFLYDNDNSDAVDDWRDVLDDFVDYKRDLVDYFKEGARTFIETFFPCGVTDTCDKDEDTPSPATTKKPMMYPKKH